MRFPLALSFLTAALFLAACSAGSVPAPDSGVFLHRRHTPPFPPRARHRVTGTDVSRARAGGWQRISAGVPWVDGPSTELLMTDGTVLVQDYCTSNWHRLTPDQNGNYTTGTWSKIAAMPSNYGPLYFASAVLPNGYVMVNGGEYNGSGCASAETNLGALYDPFTNTWTAVSPPSGWSSIGDAQSVVLANGTYMLGNCCYDYQALLTGGSSGWTQTGPGNGKGDANSEEGWTLLPNGNVLVVNVDAAPYSQVYNPNTNEWTSAGKLPVNIVTGAEIGPQTLRPNETVFVAGATGANVVYNVKRGTWSQTASFPVVSGQQLDVADGPSALLPNGNVMIPASPGLYNAPSYYYLFNGSQLTSIAAPPNAPNDSTYNTRLLLLPTGQVMETDGSTDIEMYSGNKGSGKWAPSISTAPSTVYGGNTYTVAGMGFNGVSQANMYGDDAQQASNYPLVRIVNDTTAHVFYCRTHGTSSMGVNAGVSVSTSFDVPSGIESGPATLVVVANGISSQPVAITVASSPHRKR